MPQASIIVLVILIASALFTVYKMIKLKTTYPIISKIIGGVILSFLFTVSSLFWTTDIAYDRETIKHLEYGWPMKYWEQNQERFEPPFPWEMGFAYEVSGNISEENFYKSLAINLFHPNTSVA